MIADEYFLKEWCSIASNHQFQQEDAVYISGRMLARNTSFGITQKGQVFILLNEKNYSTPFKIENVIELTSPRIFTSESGSSRLYGSGLLIRAHSVGDQFQILCLLNSILAGEDFKTGLDSFLELLRRVSLRRKRFFAPSLFAELIVIKHLRSSLPNIVSCWQSGGRSVIDIRASKENPGIEIKATTNVCSRTHSLSLHQVRHFMENKDCLVASVQVHEDHEGISCKELCEKLLEDEKIAGRGGVKILASYLVSCADEPSFSQALFNEGQTMASIDLICPSFDELEIMNPPVWLNAARLEIDFYLVPRKFTLR